MRSSDRQDLATFSLEANLSAIPEQGESKLTPLTPSLPSGCGGLLVDFELGMLLSFLRPNFKKKFCRKRTGRRKEWGGRRLPVSTLSAP